ncbi:haloacid dehalogenase-like hydrolase [Ilyonectria robusta]
MDGLLLDTEDLYTLCINTLLEKYDRPILPWSIKASLMGRPFASASAIFHEWADLPVSATDFNIQCAALQRQNFPKAQPLPGVVALLHNLSQTAQREEQGAIESGRSLHKAPRKVHLALATSSTTENFRLKTAHLQDLFSAFDPGHRVLGDDERVKPGRGKPLPDIYLLALKIINATLPTGADPVTPKECLVFEDSVPGVEAARRAGMRVVWCPHPRLKQEFEGREKDILAGKMGEGGEDMSEAYQGDEDGWAEYIDSLVNFNYEKYGILIPPC